MPLSPKQRRRMDAKARKRYAQKHRHITDLEPVLYMPLDGTGYVYTAKDGWKTESVAEPLTGAMVARIFGLSNVEVHGHALTPEERVEIAKRHGFLL